MRDIAAYNIRTAKTNNGNADAFPLFVLICNKLLFLQVSVHGINQILYLQTMNHGGLLKAFPL